MCNLCSCSKCKVSPGLANLPEPQRLPAVASDLRSSRWVFYMYIKSSPRQCTL